MVTVGLRHTVNHQMATLRAGSAGAVPVDIYRRPWNGGGAPGPRGRQELTMQDHKIPGRSDHWHLHLVLWNLGEERRL